MSLLLWLFSAMLALFQKDPNATTILLDVEKEDTQCPIRTACWLIRTACWLLLLAESTTIHSKLDVKS